jgi:hypothetical protein
MYTQYILDRYVRMELAMRYLGSLFLDGNYTVEVSSFDRLPLVIAHNP